MSAEVSQIPSFGFIRRAIEQMMEESREHWVFCGNIFDKITYESI